MQGRMKARGQFQAALVQVRLSGRGRLLRRLTVV